MWEDKVRPELDSNDLVIVDSQLDNAGEYELEILPAASNAYFWGPATVEMFKRPDLPIYIEESEDYRSNNDHAIAKPGRQVVAKCKVTGALPKVRLQWQWEGEVRGEGQIDVRERDQN